MRKAMILRGGVGGMWSRCTGIGKGDGNEEICNGEGGGGSHFF